MQIQPPTETAHAIPSFRPSPGGTYLPGLTECCGPPRGAASFRLAAVARLAMAGGLPVAYFERVSRHRQV